MRADLDGDRDLRSARAIGVRLSGGGGRGVVRRDGGSLAVSRWLRIEGPESEPVAYSGARSIGPGRPEDDRPVATSPTECGTHPARGG